MKNYVRLPEFYASFAPLREPLKCDHLTPFSRFIQTQVGSLEFFANGVSQSIAVACMDRQASIGGFLKLFCTAERPKDHY